MVDQLIYRLNRVPDLQLRQVPRADRRRAAAAGRRPAARSPSGCRRRSRSRCWSGPRPRWRPRAPTSHDPSSSAPPATWTIVPVLVRPRRHASRSARRRSTRTDGAVGGRRLPLLLRAPRRSATRCWSGCPTPCPSCAVPLRMDCQVAGVGVDPRRPPLVWEAWTDDGWAACEVDTDDTGGLNKPGDVVLHVPDGHQASIIARQRAGWLRCRLVEAAARTSRPTSTRPRVLGSTAFTIGGTAPTGARRGGARRGPRPLRRHARPAVRAAAAPGAVASDDAARRSPCSTARTQQTWTEVPHFADSGPGRPALPASTRTPARSSSGRPSAPPTATLLQLRRRPAGRAPSCGSTSYRTGGGQARQRGPRAGPGAQDQRPVRRPGGEPGAGRRRRRGRDPGRRQGPRPAAAALARPGGDRRGLRAAGPRRRAGRGPGALRRRGRAGRRGRPGAGRAARGQRRGRPDPARRPGPARTRPWSGSATASTSAGWSAPGCWCSRRTTSG